MTITIYGISNCDTVKKARTWFTTQGLAYEFHDFKKLGAPEAQLTAWVQTLGWEVLVNKKGTTWRGLDKAVQASVTDAKSAIALMQTHTSVIKRPIVEQGNKTTVGFVPEQWTGV